MAPLISAAFLLIMQSGQPSTARSEVPPVPHVRPDVLTPTPRAHIIRPRCGPHRDSLAWDFDGRRARFTSVRLLGRTLSAADLSALDRAAEELGGDLLVRVRCDHAAATLDIFAANFVGSEQTRRRDFDYHPGKLVRAE